MVMDEEKARRARAGFEMLLALYDFGETTLRNKLRRKYPGATEAAIDAMIVAWLERRPGAEDGDGEGIKGEWPRRA